MATETVGANGMWVFDCGGLQPWPERPISRMALGIDGVEGGPPKILNLRLWSAWQAVARARLVWLWKGV
jgi:hypothetical protein